MNRYEHLTDHELLTLATGGIHEANTELAKRTELKDIMVMFLAGDPELAGEGFDGVQGHGLVVYTTDGYIVMDITQDGITLEYSPQQEMEPRQIQLKVV